LSIQENINPDSGLAQFFLTPQNDVATVDMCRKNGFLVGICGS